MPKSIRKTLNSIRKVKKDIILLSEHSSKNTVSKESLQLYICMWNQSKRPWHIDYIDHQSYQENIYYFKHDDVFFNENKPELKELKEAGWIKLWTVNKSATEYEWKLAQSIEHFHKDEEEDKVATQIKNLFK